MIIIDEADLPGTQTIIDTISVTVALSVAPPRAHGPAAHQSLRALVRHPSAAAGDGGRVRAPRSMAPIAVPSPSEARADDAGAGVHRDRCPRTPPPCAGAALGPADRGEARGPAPAGRHARPAAHQAGTRRRRGPDARRSARGIRQDDRDQSLVRDPGRRARMGDARRRRQRSEPPLDVCGDSRRPHPSGARPQQPCNACASQGARPSLRSTSSWRLWLVMGIR